MHKHTKPMPGSNLNRKNAMVTSDYNRPIVDMWKAGESIVEMFRVKCGEFIKHTGEIIPMIVETTLNNQWQSSQQDDSQNSNSCSSFNQSRGPGFVNVSSETMEVYEEITFANVFKKNPLPLYSDFNSISPGKVKTAEPIKPIPSANRPKDLLDQHLGIGKSFQMSEESNSIIQTMENLNCRDAWQKSGQQNTQYLANLNVPWDSDDDRFVDASDSIKKVIIQKLAGRRNNAVQPQPQKTQEQIWMEDSEEYEISSQQSGSPKRRNHKVTEIWEDDVDLKPPALFSRFVKKTQSFQSMMPPSQLGAPLKIIRLNNFRQQIERTPKKTSISKKRRRLYCQEKRIPRWAEDKHKAAAYNIGKNYEDVFGVCIVEELNIKVMFQDFKGKAERCFIRRTKHRANPALYQTLTNPVPQRGPTLF